MTDRLEAYAAFVGMMQMRSFSAVGRQMRVSQSTISKHIAGLESEFGVQLFTRTTRRISPTPEANRVYEHVQRMLDSLEAARAAVRGQQPEASGTLRLAVPTSLGRSRILPLVPGFLRRNPLMSVEAILVDEVKDLVAEGFELAITNIPRREGSLISRSLMGFDLLVVASPAYLAGISEPEVPIDLESHLMILSTRFTDDLIDFDSENGRQRVQLRGRLRTNSDEVAYEAALAGQGIAIVPSWLTNSDIASGSIRSLMPEYYLPTVPVQLIYPQTRFLSRRARSFIDYIVPELSRDGSRPRPRILGLVNVAAAS